MKQVQLIDVNLLLIDVNLLLIDVNLHLTLQLMLMIKDLHLSSKYHQYS